MAAMAAAVRLKYEQACPECGSTDTVDDRSAGDLICRGCGLVLEAHTVDESSEWRTFADGDANAVDPNRVGGPVNDMLSDGGLGTSIQNAPGAAGPGARGSLAALQRSAAGGSGADRALLKAFSEMAKLGDQLRLVRSIRERANQIFKEVSATSAVKGRRLAGVYAAVLHLACKEENHPRAFKEILAVVKDASKKDVTRAYNLIMQHRQKQGFVAAHPADFVARAATQLGLSYRDTRATQELAEAAKPREDGSARDDARLRSWDGRSPLSIAGALILLISRLPGAAAQPTAPIAEAVGLAEGTIRSVYGEVFDDVKALVPQWYASPAVVEASRHS